MKRIKEVLKGHREWYPFYAQLALVALPLVAFSLKWWWPPIPIFGYPLPIPIPQ